MTCFNSLQGARRVRTLCYMLTLSFLNTAFLNGCAMGPDYQPPKTSAPKGFAQAAPPEFSSQGIELRWWTLFQDKQLTALVEQAVLHNFDLKTARANLQEARALYLEAGLNILPSVTSHANYNDQKRSVGALNNRSFVPRELKLYNLGFDAAWELDFFGRVSRSLEASNDEVDMQAASLRDLKVSLIAEVARNYFELRGLQQQLHVAQQNVANQQETLTITQAKLDNGRGTEFDTASARAQLDTTQADLPALTSAIQKARHRLSVLTGQLPDALTKKLSSTAPLPRLPASIHIGTPADLLRRRPDVRMAERSLAASTARIGIATADLFPRVTFVGSISLEASTLSGIGAAGSDTFSAGPRISWAAFDLGRVYARIKAADAHAEAELAHYQQTVLNALEETENALLSYNQERARQQLLLAATQASQHAQELAKVRYDAGITDFQALLDADARLLQTQVTLSQTETSVATALTAIYKALGGGWEAGL